MSLTSLFLGPGFEYPPPHENVVVRLQVTLDPGDEILCPAHGRFNRELGFPQVNQESEDFVFPFLEVLLGKTPSLPLVWRQLVAVIVDDGFLWGGGVKRPFAKTRQNMLLLVIRI